MRSLFHPRGLLLVQARRSRSTLLQNPEGCMPFRGTNRQFHLRIPKLNLSKRHKSTSIPNEHSAAAGAGAPGSSLQNFMLKPRSLPIPRWVSPRYYTFTISELCGHASFILVAMSYAVDDFLELRIIAVAGSAVMLCFTYFHPHGRVLWLPFRWNALFIAINSYRIGKVMLDRYFADQLSPELLRIRDSHFYVLERPDFARLARIGTIETYQRGDLVVAQGELHSHIRLVLDGEFNILRDGQLTYKVEEGNFLSETGLHAGLLLPGRVESCCSIVAVSKEAHVLSWERNALMDLLHRETQLRRALKAVSSWDIVRKLKGQRKLLASGAIPDPDKWTLRRNQQNQHRYAAILQNMLAHPKYLKQRKAELEKYRLIHHIDDVDHKLALERNGWTVEDFEKGYREGGHETDLEEEEEDFITKGLRWRAYDIYMRIFG